MTNFLNSYATEADGFRILVEPDPNARSPRESGFRNLGHIRIPPDKRFGRLTSDDVADRTSLGSMVCRYGTDKDAIALPLYAIYTGDETSGYFQIHRSPFFADRQGAQVGYIAATHSEVLGYFNRPSMSEELYRASVDRMTDEIMLMNTYLCGEVYRYQVMDAEDEVVAQGSSIYESEMAVDEAMEAVERLKASTVPGMLM
ncbi:hypothetical protein [Salipiger sp. PrR003]|uniref:hypothetical protein n=1 Tax=Salipiger sp. PrR003 TaxID=2706776 RepID=UPI0013DC7CA6|nr:hypothetical protein [Salipiger sp. PrR003]NDV51485.1 hypothetical protein [Salipiger sp. PrR003]